MSERMRFGWDELDAFLAGNPRIPDPDEAADSLLYGLKRGDQPYYGDADGGHCAEEAFDSLTAISALSRADIVMSLGRALMRYEVDNLDPELASGVVNVDHDTLAEELLRHAKALRAAIAPVFGLEVYPAMTAAALVWLGICLMAREHDESEGGPNRFTGTSSEREFGTKQHLEEWRGKKGAVQTERVTTDFRPDGLVLGMLVEREFFPRPFSLAPEDQAYLLSEMRRAAA